MTFAERMPIYRDRVNLALEHWLPPAETCPERFHAALRYAVMGGGKRLRPLLSYAAGEWLHIAPERIDGIAVALEIVHAYSLVHDDLPAMDDDGLRRGRPTTHIAFDEATAILVGDALQAHAYYVLATDAGLQVEAQIRRQLIIDLASCSGSDGLVAGQAMDIEEAGASMPTPADIEEQYRLKTGRLLQSAITMPCRLLFPGNDAQLALANRFGRAVGLGFQIADDLLEIQCPADVTGKPQGSDARNCRATLPSLIGLPAALQRLDDLRAEALAVLADAGAEADALRWLCDWALVPPGTAANTG